MARSRRRSRGSGPISRRRVLLALGAGLTGAGALGTKAFSTASADRGVSLDSAEDANAIVGLVIENPVQKVREGSQTPLVKIANNTPQKLTYTVSLGSEGTLYNPDGGSGNPVSVTIASGEPKTIDIGPAPGGKEIEFDISANSTDFEFNATRSTSVEGLDYDENSNYRDNVKGDAAQPTNASGEIKNPGAVNEQDGDSATAISSGSQEDLKVGYALPTVDKTASEYEIFFDIDRTQIGQGGDNGNGQGGDNGNGQGGDNGNGQGGNNDGDPSGDFGFYVTNDADPAKQLTSRRVLSTGENTYTFSQQENQDIDKNADDLYLIIDSQTAGKGNRELELDYFQLSSV